MLPHGSNGSHSAAVILLYHRVGANPIDTNDLQVHRDDFLRQLRHIVDHYDVVSVERIVKGLESGQLPSRAVAVTFDDGYLENLDAVAPLLHEYRVPATFFVTTEQLSKPHENWWDVVERVMTRDTPVRLELAGELPFRATTCTPEERSQAQRALNARMYPLSMAARNAMLTALQEWSGTSVQPRDSHRVLVREELQRLAAQPGICIGAHSVHHVALSHQSEDECRFEVSRSRSDLFSLLGRPINGFSYPYGDWNTATVDIVRQAGFHYAVTVEPRAVTVSAERLLLPRCEVKAAFAHRFEEWLADKFTAHCGQAAQGDGTAFDVND